MEVISLKCPNCNAGVSSNQTCCEYCGQPIIIREASIFAEMSMPQINKYMLAYAKIESEHFGDEDINLALGLCFLKLKKYDDAIQAFEKGIATNPYNAALLYYHSVALLRGKKPFLGTKKSIDKIIENIEAATVINSKPEYYYLLWYVKDDFYRKKCLKTFPTAQECLNQAINCGLSDSTIRDFLSISGICK